MFLASRATPGAARRRLAGVCCLSLLALAACSGGEEDPEPIIRSDAASSSSSAESPSESSPAQPSEEPWERRTKAGAVAFVKHWVDVFNQAGATGDTSELREISAKGCASCAQFAQLIDDWTANGSQLESDGWQVRLVQGVDGQSKGPFDIAVRINRTPQVITQPDGKETSYPGSTETYGTVAVWVQDSWRLRKFNQLT